MAGLFWLPVSVGSVHCQLGPRQKLHSRKTWWKKALPCMVVRKQRWKGGPGRRTHVPSLTHRVPPLPARSRLPKSEFGGTFYIQTMLLWLQPQTSFHISFISLFSFPVFYLFKTNGLKTNNFLLPVIHRFFFLELEIYARHIQLSSVRTSRAQSWLPPALRKRGKTPNARFFCGLLVGNQRLNP